MSDDAQGVAASVAEVAAFAWSLIELLFSRILPLLGFLVAQLVLQAGRLALEVVSPSSPSPYAPRIRRRRPHGWSSWLSEQQSWPTYAAAELATPTYHNAAAAGRWVDSYLNDYESPAPPYATADHVEIAEKAEALPAAQDAIAADAERSEQKPSVAAQDRAAVPEQAGPSDIQIPMADPQHEQPRPSSLQSDRSHSESPVEDRLALVPNSIEAPVSNGQQEESAMPAAGADSSAEAVPSTPSDRRSTDDSLSQLSAHAQDEELEPSKPVSGSTEESGAARGDEATQRRVENADKAEVKGEMSKADQGSADRQQFTRRKSPSSKKRHPFANVLPPSLSQIKHTLMQKSRRVSPSWLH